MPVTPICRHILFRIEDRAPLAHVRKKSASVGKRLGLLVGVDVRLGLFVRRHRISDSTIMKDDDEEENKAG